MIHAQDDLNLHVLSIFEGSFSLDVAYLFCFQGGSGRPGPRGASGRPGDKGEAGSIGPAGPIGPVGPAGASGERGRDGSPGPAVSTKMLLLRKSMKRDEMN